MKFQNGAFYFREAFHDARHAIGKGTNCEVKTWPKAVSCYSLGKGTYYEVKSWPKADSQNLAKGCELPSCDGQLQLTDGGMLLRSLVLRWVSRCNWVCNTNRRFGSLCRSPTPQDPMTYDVLSRISFHGRSSNTVIAKFPTVSHCVTSSVLLDGLASVLPTRTWTRHRTFCTRTWRILAWCRNPFRWPWDRSDDLFCQHGLRRGKKYGVASTTSLTYAT